MKVEQRQWRSNKGWSKLNETVLSGSPQLVFVFGRGSLLKEPTLYDEIKQFYPNSHVLLCSTAGEIYDDAVYDNSLSLAAIYFEKTEVKFAACSVKDSSMSYEVGKQLADNIDHNDLVHLMVFSEGLNVNGTNLVRGLTDNVPKTVSITGGLVGDGSDFHETVIGFDGPASSNQAIVIGFYGSNLKIGYGSLGGWDTFGPERLITKSHDNILEELDGKSALELYKQYLGEQAAKLPGSGLLFPMSLRDKNPDGTETELVRTVLGVDEEKQTMTFAGNMPEGTYAKLMKANFDRLIDGAAGAANMSIEPLEGSRPDLAILISCVGRKLVLKERIDEEVEAVRSTFGSQAALTGFYSYGEICPTASTEKQCQLHNQTMTITTFRELV